MTLKREFDSDLALIELFQQTTIALQAERVSSAVVSEAALHRAQARARKRLHELRRCQPMPSPSLGWLADFQTRATSMNFGVIFQAVLKVLDTLSEAEMDASGDPERYAIKSEFRAKMHYA